MAQAAGERVAYYNGRIVLERDVRVPFRDRGFKYGDAVFDTTRTFGHRIFRLKDHLDRLYRSLRYLRIDPGIGLEDLQRITEEVLHKNLPLLEPDDDYWVTQRVTRGLDPSDRATFGQSGPTVIVECLPLPLRERATLYRDGIRVVVPSVRRAAPDSLSARTKTNNYLNVVMGDLEAKSRDPEAWAILLDVNGNLAEGIGSNVFLVRDGAIYTPREQFVLPGISRETAIDLARELGYTVHERDIDLFDAYNADEAFLTSTSLCVCPVRSFNGVELGGGRVPGPVTQRVIEAYCRMVDHDFVAQYLEAPRALARILVHTVDTGRVTPRTGRPAARSAGRLSRRAVPAASRPSTRRRRTTRVVRASTVGLFAAAGPVRRTAFTDHRG